MIPKCVAVANASINLWSIQTSLHVLVFAFEVVKWAISLFEMVKCQKAIKCRNYNFYATGTTRKISSFRLLISLRPNEEKFFNCSYVMIK
jgi:hypothetical protein